MNIKYEEWKDILGYEGKYLVSNFGRVMNIKKEILKPQLTKQGYHKVTLFNKQKKGKLVHRLVMETFVGKSKLQVNHKDFNKTNNYLDNLEYTTSKENIEHYRNSNKPTTLNHLTKGSSKYNTTIAHLEYLEWLIKDIPENDIDAIVKVCYDYVNS